MRKLAQVRCSTHAVVAVILSTLVLASCGEGTDNPPSTPSTPSTTTVSTPANYPPVPSADDLNTLLQKGFDPAVPLSDKVSLVEGAESDPTIIDKVAEAARVNNATVTVVDVTDLGDGTLSSNASIEIAGQSNPFQVTFVAEDGMWKLSRENACAIVSLASLASSACG